MKIDEAKKTLKEYAHKRIIKINKMHCNVKRFYYEEKKSMETLIDILEFSVR